jgi:hypothetical protein
MCGSSSLNECSPLTSTCSCLSSLSTMITYKNRSFCADTLELSNCERFPSRCIHWCNSTSNSLCICPNDTQRIERNNMFTCELFLHVNHCSTNDTIRRCPSERCCIQGQCQNCSFRTTSTVKKILT